MLENLTRDIRYSIRQLARTPFFTMACAVSMGMGIAVTVAAYSIIGALLHRPLPVPDRDNVVHVFAAMEGDSFGYSSFNALESYRAQNVFSGLVAYSSGGGTFVANNRAPARESFHYVTPDYFRVLGVQLRGRSFVPDGKAPEIVISDAYRRRAFGSKDRVLGASILINNRPFTIVGVAPKSFRGLEYSDVVGWVPLQSRLVINPGGRIFDGWKDRTWSIAGRLAAGVTTTTAQYRLQPVARDFALAHREWRDGREPLTIKVFTHAQRNQILIQESLAEALLVLGSIIAVVMILSCTNVAGLLLARSVTRRHEVAVRITLGASRVRLISQFMTEAVMLALLGGTMGWIAGDWLIAFLTRNPMFSRVEIHPDWRVLIATAITTLLSAVIFGATPIAHTLRVNVKAGMNGSGVIGERGGVRGRLLALQVCLSCLLLVLGLHATRGVAASVKGTVGFDTDNLIVAQLDLFGLWGDSARLHAFVNASEEILRATPGVMRTTTSRMNPVTEGTVSTRSPILRPDGRATVVRRESVRLDYFRTLGVTMRRGELPATIDGSDPRHLAVVTRAFIDSMGRDVVGSTITLADNVNATIIGEVNEVVRSKVNVGLPMIYELAPDKRTESGRLLIARVMPGTERDVMAAFTRGMRARFPDRVPPQLSTMNADIATYNAPQRYVSKAALSFGAAELILAAIGLYSVLLYSMLTRTREIGVRMALGARPASASFTVMQDGLTFIGIGLGMGILVAIPASIVAAKNFPGARLGDIAPPLVALLAIIVTSTAACLVPARKAAAVEPMEALRHE